MLNSITSCNVILHVTTPMKPVICIGALEMYSENSWGVLNCTIYRLLSNFALKKCCRFN